MPCARSPTVLCALTFLHQNFQALGSAWSIPSHDLAKVDEPTIAKMLIFAASSGRQLSKGKALFCGRLKYMILVVLCYHNNGVEECKNDRTMLFY